ncbi:uncharacterized protein MAM_00497 [Metarhizium album ARSEF 1941]|uniref:Uncharacterized protein n=1 Tax=Metarhizium album (strain ARSEF 1941) TaxID=1081103 RepID=A0A0B2X867_METAS|nr:uncharacterized protein MAM_00497 [Metarhizium album ARSEF 1941]KHO01496.1 hypothetical protein MAM_00497 [Metarhizium album ARSEF 1941]
MSGPIDTKSSYPVDFHITVTTAEDRMNDIENILIDAIRGAGCSYVRDVRWSSRAQSVTFKVLDAMEHSQGSDMISAYRKVVDSLLQIPAFNTVSTEAFHYKFVFERRVGSE